MRKWGVAFIAGLMVAAASPPGAAVVEPCSDPVPLGYAFRTGFLPIPPVKREQTEVTSLVIHVFMVSGVQEYVDAWGGFCVSGKEIDSSSGEGGSEADEFVDRVHVCYEHFPIGSIVDDAGEIVALENEPEFLGCLDP